MYDRLRTLAGEAGSVFTEYGGFEIHVRDAEAFPWGRVMELLTNVGHDVWVEKRHGVLMIQSKPPSV